MYTVRIVHHPGPGKAAELRVALEEHSAAANAAGSPHNVSQLLYGPEPTLVNAIRYEDLGALDAYAARNASDSAYQARTAKITACLARPQTSTLYENLVTTARSSDVNYALRRTFYPEPGKAAELRQVLEARANTSSPGSAGKGLTTQVLGPDRPHFVLTTLFSSLEGFEQYLKAQSADQGVQAFAAQIGNLSAPGSRTELYRILLPFAS